MPTNNASTRLLATVDSEHIRLFTAQKTPDRGWWISEIADEHNTWKDRIDTARPHLTGTQQAVHTIARKEEDREMNHRFGKEVITTIERIAQSHKADRFDIFAASTMFPQLRQSLEDNKHNNHTRFRVHQHELMKTTPEQLATHPAVKECLG
ncbi:MAG: host attachment protein [Phycisphaerales bacterium]